MLDRHEPPGLRRARWLPASVPLTSVLLTALLLIGLRPAVGLAGDQLVIPLEFDLHNFAGVGVGAYPSYMGADEQSVGVAPLMQLGLGGERYVRLLVNRLQFNLLDEPNWRLGPVAQLRFGRGQVDDPVVRRLRSIDSSLGLGLFGSYQWRAAGDPRQQAGLGGWSLWDAGNDQGWTAGLNAHYTQPIALPLVLGGGLAATYGSGDYMNTYFGVGPIDALASGLPVYRASAGLRDVRGWTAALLHLSPHWHLTAGLLYARLLGPAADSPIVTERGSRDQWVYGMGVIYAW